jgi:predicted DNA-binding transcriptional regulator AlpA
MRAMTETPFEWQIWSVEKVAEYLSHEVGYTRDRIVTLPDFPQPIRIAGKGRPRWRAIEVAKWVLAQRNGRPRQSV